MNTASDLLYIHFPGLLPEAAPQGLPAAVRFLDPGLGATAASPRPETAAVPARAFLPPDLPMDRRQAARYLRDMLALGQGFKRPGDIAQLLAQDESLALGPDLRAEFADLDRFTAGSGPKAAGASALDAAALAGTLAVARLTAQRTLILAAATEREEWEARTLGHDFDASLERFDASLGFDQEGEEDEDRAVLQRGTGLRDLAGSGPAASRRVILEAMAALLPESAALVTADPEVEADWAEAGVALAPPADGTAGALAAALADWPGPVLAGRAPLWRLAGRRRPPENAPWLERDMDVICLRPA
ncbi:MAG: hypothetical protein H0S85_05440 [Desulfovibrionaceae bacterium]|jgi:hypothetical protein|nr:hypothetical protein [Desulfovibrionaceae bacterium]